MRNVIELNDKTYRVVRCWGTKDVTCDWCGGQRVVTVDGHGEIVAFCELCDYIPQSECGIEECEACSV